MIVPIKKDPRSRLARIEGHTVDLISLVIKISSIYFQTNTAPFSCQDFFGVVCRFRSPLVRYPASVFLDSCFPAYRQAGAGMTMIAKEFMTQLLMHERKSLSSWAWPSVFRFGPESFSARASSPISSSHRRSATW